MNLVIDVGNTRTKLAVFNKRDLIDVIIIDKNEFLTVINNLKLKYKLKKGIISKVSNFPKEFINQLDFIPKVIFLNNKTNVPFINSYKTKDTLGIDRIALASSAVKNFPKENVLVIDAGTCVTYDFINAREEYEGGAISPGLSIRYKSLKDYTSKLPFLKTKSPDNFIGKSTEDSIHSGVVNGLINEINGTIDQYKSIYPHLTVVLTGGDTKFLSKQLKSSIFANQNFLLLGLNEILIFNENK